METLAMLRRPSDAEVTQKQLAPEAKPLLRQRLRAMRKAHEYTFTEMRGGHVTEQLELDLEHLLERRETAAVPAVYRNAPTPFGAEHFARQLIVGRGNLHLPLGRR